MESTAILEIGPRPALVAGPLSPLKSVGPFPATLVTIPLDIFRTTRKPSATYRFPARSTATLVGSNKGTPVAGPVYSIIDLFRSGVKRKGILGPPTAVVITPPDTLRIRSLTLSAM